MKTLYSSTFISIILAFLMFLGKSGQPVEIVENPKQPSFSYQSRKEGPAFPEKIRIEIFEDLMCAHCTDFSQNTLPKIKDLEQETDEIDLQLYFIPDINDDLLYQAAMSLKCAADQEGFWGMHQKIHEHKDDLNKKSFVQFGKELELNAEALIECMDEEVYKKSIEADILYASEQSIIFKPTILINEYKLIGNQPFENIQKIINGFLKEKRGVEIKSEALDQTTDLKQELETFEPPATNL